MTRLWIVRHGNTFAADEAPRRIGARTDLPLVASGRAQAEALGNWFGAQKIGFGAVLASRLRRSRDTAIGIVGLGVPVETAAWLDEIDHGPDENRLEDEVVARIGTTVVAEWDARAVAPPGWIVDAPRRVAGWKRLMSDAVGDILLVTSNGAARFALFADPLLAVQAASLPHLKLRTGAWGRIDRCDAGWRLAEWDRRP